ncbi:class I SAM-dependent methyltransferase [Desulfobotulus sp. H1]|uniref:Class I SAM-dependent methyltransferase n=1 Tax=Desulfobotulus pelophilus TaxID=2823377 RepID=A0ABT3N7R5_9BACT|nr:class I SAM-dependent methyltransferase [Desulfobotulus pelophilus]MCW7753498.1 class I SAM-dependent methyltransferase [Desulfobotulus pelophilus]
MFACPLCHSADSAVFFRGKRRLYLRCGECLLVFVDPVFHLSSSAEKAVYELHENDPEDEGYRRFISRLVIPLNQKLGERGRKGLDFGCGPGPALPRMMAEAGHSMAVYDPFFAPDASVLEELYDFITCTEVVEHWNVPAWTWPFVLGMLRPGGWLGIMTKLVLDGEAFARWHYKNDPTHVSFFSRETFSYLAQKGGLRVIFEGKDVILMQKPVLTDE